ncbi:hypothetical protein [Pedobacter sp. D749]|uniref:hypothetical protein n=1 Tax=Pedobacter sp. D749 TaxID=2856523 RepID=UPI001C55F06C|nr:hypothetical protein [Pedobacter sp. D749]QXU42819.1 hypothetical protein KYH19_04255 [Pedobacter sp. D749]
MAKEIKAIKYPQCSSTAKTEIKPDVYPYINRQTEYYLDDDDITVNYNHNYSYANANLALGAQKTKLVIAIAAIVFVILAISILAGLLSKSAPIVNNSLPGGNAEPQKEYLAQSLVASGYKGSQINLILKLQS